MRHFKFLFYLCSIVLLSSCVVQHKAAKYNDKIINEQHAVVEEMGRFLRKFRNGSLEDLKKHKEMLLQKTNASIKKLEGMPGYEGDFQLRDGAIELLKFYKSTLEKDYEEMLHMIVDKNRSKESHEKLRQYAQNLIKQEEEMDDKFAKIQEAFVAKHKLELVKHPIKE